MMPPRPTLLIFSRHLMQDKFAGNSAHVRSLVDYLRANGIRVVLLIPSLRGLGRKPFARVKLDRTGFDAIALAGGVRIGPWLVRYAPAVWARAVRLAAARAWRRRRAGMAGEDRFWDIGPMDAGERRAVRAAARRFRPDAAFANYFFLCDGLRAPELAHAAKITMVHDIFHARVESFRASGLPLPHAPVTQAHELADLAQAETLLSVQEAEAALLRRLLPARTTLLMPIAFPIRPAETEPEPNRVFFVGSDNEVNVIGLDWLLRAVWPLLREHRPAARLAVYGNVVRGASIVPDGVELVGRVDDLAAAYHRSALCVVPLRAGSGQKVKLVEAMCHGRATVATLVGAQGFEHLAGTCFALADDADAFAAACAGILADPGRRRAFERAALAQARERYSEAACYGAVLRQLQARVADGAHA